MEVLTMSEIPRQGEVAGRSAPNQRNVAHTSRVRANGSARAEGTVARRSLRVLIVDDDWDTADGLAQLVGHWGHDVRSVCDGAAGLEAAAAHVPEVVLLDVIMPGMNGCDLAQQLRLDARLKRCFLIAITGYSGAQWRQQCSEAGIDVFLIKPVDASILEALLLLEGERLGPARNHHRSGEPIPIPAAALRREMSLCGKDGPTRRAKAR
jgi:CheY-like chemotaxis protein